MPRAFEEFDFNSQRKPTRLQSATTAVTDAAVALPVAVACGVAGSVIGAVEAFGQHWSDANGNKQAADANHCDKHAGDKIKKNVGGNPRNFMRMYKTPPVEEKSAAKALTHTVVAVGGATASAVGGAYNGALGAFQSYMSDAKKKKQAARALAREGVPK